jgi:hypothetical protein
MLPTRADNAENTVLTSRRNSGRKCFATRAGPMTLQSLLLAAEPRAVLAKPNP